MEIATAALPAHVPASLVRPFPFAFGATTDRDPFNDLAAEVHRGPPIFWAEDVFPGGRPAWVVRRNEDLRTIYLDTEHFSNKDWVPFAKLIGESWNQVPLESDPPIHALHRSFINPLFAPKTLSKLDERITQYAGEYAAALRDKGACEFVTEFAFELPIKVFLELMGLPLALTKQFLEWEYNLIHAADMAHLINATRSVVSYLRDEIASRRTNPNDDLISYGLQVEIDGRRLTDDELVGFTFNLFIGGLDTVSTNISQQFWHLATHAEDQATLRANPSMIPAAIEEMLRAYASATTFRTCIKPVEINGVTMLPGDKVTMSTTLAGRDPEAFDCPNDVVLDRKPRHSSFGYGPHLCVGMHLARREMKIAMEQFFNAIPTFTLAPDTQIQFHLGGMVQPKKLPLIWDI